MFSKLIVVASALLVLSFPARAAYDVDAPVSLTPSAASSITEQMRDETRPRRGTLYRVSLGDRTSYLFGTIHVGKTNFFPLNPEVMQAWDAASSVVLELDTRNSTAFYAALEKHGLYPVGDSIARHVSASAYQQLTQTLIAAKVDPAKVARYKPWLVANLLVGRVLEQRGYLSAQGIETYLLAPPQLQGKRVLELESAEFQLALFDSLSDADEEKYMLENLADLNDGSAVRKTEGLVDAWSRGDDSTVDRLLSEITSGNTVSSNFMQQTLLGARNVQMAANIDHIIKGNAVAFVGVGMLHLAGAQGLPQLLRQRGYLVEKIY